MGLLHEPVTSEVACSADLNLRPLRPESWSIDNSAPGPVVSVCAYPTRTGRYWCIQVVEKNWPLVLVLDVVA